MLAELQPLTLKKQVQTTERYFKRISSDKRFAIELIMCGQCFNPSFTISFFEFTALVNSKKSEITK